MRISTHVGIPGLDTRGGGRPTLNLNFVGADRLDPQITFTRASTARYFNSAGVLTSAAINEARFDYNPATLAPRGLLIEEQRTNSIRNNTMQGAVAGTPGTNPTNWVVTNPADSITPQIVGVGTSNGITYIDIKYTGTSGVSGSATLIQFESNTQVAASNGQTWTTSAYVAVVGGSTTNISSLVLRTRFNNAAGSSVTTGGDISLTTATSTLSRFVITGTATDALTAFVNSTIVANFADNSAIDITLRIGLPQLELGAFATSVIPTTTTALTRSADVASVNTLSPWFNSTASTLYAEFVWEGLKSTSGQAYAQFDDGSTNNRIVAAAGSSNANIMTTTSGGTSDGSVATPATVFAANTIYKTALALAANDLQSFVNGTAGTADTTVTLPVGLTNFKLGASLSATANVWLRRATYYPRRLSQAEGIAITA